MANTRFNVSKSTSATKSGTKKSKWWLWLLIAIIGLVIVGFLLKKCSSDGTKTVEAPTNAVPVDQVVVPQKSDQAQEPTTPTTQSEIQQAPSPVQPSPSNTPVSTSLIGSLDEKALQVIRGDFGNGLERKEKLGNEYQAIQRRVNEMWHAGVF